MGEEGGGVLLHRSGPSGQVTRDILLMKLLTASKRLFYRRYLVMLLVGTAWEVSYVTMESVLLTWQSYITERTSYIAKGVKLLYSKD